jgi:hypothetical protein
MLTAKFLTVKMQVDIPNYICQYERPDLKARGLRPMAQKPPVEYGARLAEAQERKNWTNEQCWTELDISDTTWFNWKRTGKVPPSRVSRLKRVLGVEPLHPTPAMRREWALEEAVSALQEQQQQMMDRLASLEKQQPH